MLKNKLSFIYTSRLKIFDRRTILAVQGVELITDEGQELTYHINTP